MEYRNYNRFKRIIATERSGGKKKITFDQEEGYICNDRGIRNRNRNFFSEQPIDKV
jgi:hypothetical protein